MPRLRRDLRLSPSAPEQWEALTRQAIALENPASTEYTDHLRVLLRVHTARADLISQLAEAAETEATRRGDDALAIRFKALWNESKAAKFCLWEISGEAYEGGELSAALDAKQLYWQTRTS